jgi:hypothetical protein
MSSDIIFRRSVPGDATGLESRAAFAGPPYWEICRRIHERALQYGHTKLAADSRYAKQDGYMFITDLDLAGYNLVIDELRCILSDLNIYGYEAELIKQPWYIKVCHEQGVEPKKDLSQLRQSTEAGIRHLIEKISKLVEERAHLSTPV